MREGVGEGSFGDPLVLVRYSFYSFENLCGSLKPGLGIQTYDPWCLKPT